MVLGSVPVGLDPVAVRFASSNEAWVVNHISSSISIVDVTKRTVIATVEMPAGPSDLVFAGAPRRAWVSCSRTNAVCVVDPVTRSVVTNINIEGERPRAMATSPDGTKVYVAIFESGNGTTILSRRLTFLPVEPPPGPVDDPTGPHGGINPPPNSGRDYVPAMNPANRAPPPVGLIVRKDWAGRWMDDNSGDWTEWISGTNAAKAGRVPGWDLPDRDVAMIDTSTLEVTCAHRLMNICMGVAVNPMSGEIAVIGTDAMNERRFEPVLNGVFLRVNIALVDPVTRTNRLRDLNPHLDYATRTLPQDQRAASLGDPRGIEWSADGTRAYITGMGSRNMIVVDKDGSRINPQPVELGEGPTGIAVDEARARVYVWNRFSSSISVVDTSAGVVVTNVPVFDPTPDIIRKGRRHLYDTRKTSGLGIAACASCHVDGRTDRLAWDLGDPAGDTVANQNQEFHPMKGPMVTQTFQDIITPFLGSDPRSPTAQSLHWRGDRKNLEEFNPTFTDLQANDVELSTNEMAEFKGMLATIFFPPNFLRTLTNGLPASVALPGHYGRPPTNGDPASPLPPGNPQLARLQFAAQCSGCHSLTRGGRASATEIFVIPRAGAEGGFKIAQLRSLLDKVGMDHTSTNSRAGFGYLHDGRVGTLTQFLIDGFGSAFATDQSIANMVAFFLCFPGSDIEGGPNLSQDVPAATGREVTFASSTPPSLLNDMFNLALDLNSRLDLIVRGHKEGRARSWLLRRITQDFLSDRNGETARTLAEVIAAAAPGNEFTAILVPRGTGARLALDRDEDSYFNTTEVETGANPDDPASHPSRITSISRVGTEVTLTWESVSGARYTVEARASLPSDGASAWTRLLEPFVATSDRTTYTNALPEVHTARFYRVRMEPKE